MGPHRRSRSSDDGGSGSRGPEAEWVLARPRDESKTLQRKLCRLFIDGERRWCTANATGAAPGQDSAVGNQATRAAASMDSGGGELTRIKWITPRLSVTPAEGSRRSSTAPDNGAHTRASASWRLKTAQRLGGPPVSEPGRVQREPVSNRTIEDERWRSPDLNHATAKGRVLEGGWILIQRLTSLARSDGWEGGPSGLDRAKWLESDSGSSQRNSKPNLGFEFD